MIFVEGVGDAVVAVACDAVFAAAGGGGAVGCADLDAVCRAVG